MPGAAAATPREDAAADSEADEELRWRKSLPLTFAARHDHRIGGCDGRLLLDSWGIEFRSSEHGRWRWTFDEIRALEREEPSRLHVETDDRDVLALGKRKSYNFSLGKPLGDAGWTRYRKLAKK